MIFKATFTGRERNAIGIFYEITAYVEANTPEEANLKLYDNYDHIFKLRMIAVPFLESKPPPKLHIV